MNMVFFDVVPPSPYADGVLLDNQHAVASLLRALKGLGGIAYVGWGGGEILSAGERERAFVRQQPGAKQIQRIPWRARSDLARLAGRIADGVASSADRPAAILCGDGEIGVAIRKALNSRGLERIEVASPDEYPESLALSISVYRQDFEKMAATTFACLMAQNQAGWKASVYRVKGELLPAQRSVR
jgi:DNA-binding LacI/PurR family transcriptional regulator